MLMLLTGNISGKGITVMLNVSVGPSQPFEKPETLTTAVTELPLILVAENDPIFPVPFGFIPIAGLSIDQLMIAPVKLVLRLICGTVAP
jgi:hypothetical protein